MPIISTIGRRSLKTRALVFTIYALLIVGAVSMIYPFLLMVAGSSKSNADVSESRLIPRFMVNDEALWVKHLEGLFNEKLSMMRQVYDCDAPAYRYTDRLEMTASAADAESAMLAAEKALAASRARKLPGEDTEAQANALADARRTAEEARRALRARLGLPDTVNARMVELWREFITAQPQPHYAYTVGYIQALISKGVMPKALRELKDELSSRYDGDIDKFNQDYQTQFQTWSTLSIGTEQYLTRRDKPRTSKLDLDLREFKARQPIEDRYYFSPQGAFKEIVLKTKYSRKISKYNQEHGTSYTSYDQVHFDRSLPVGPARTEKQREDWLSFVRQDLSMLWIRADAGAAPHYRDFLKAKYGSIAALNEACATSHVSFEDIPLVSVPPDSGAVRSDWMAFLEGWSDPRTGKEYRLADEDLRVHSTEFAFQDYLKDRFATIDRLNAAAGTSFDNWIDISPPQQDMHYLAFQERTGALRWEFVARNYITVWDYIVLHGRGILNTTIFCILAVGGALIVNPLAAYALSRYKPPSSYKVLLFLMLTMAFPPMVTQIPVFLMLRQFGMLNTFWALILPGLANGYSIFLLKGFFDSLPQELYESAELDGAGEFRIFWQITMSLSKPILAVIALGAFNRAYATFMFALLICQDQKMWTLMVWLYQLRDRSGQGVIFAALLVAAIPTFLIFVFCQKIIMRGIVVPVEK